MGPRGHGLTPQHLAHYQVHVQGVIDGATHAQVTASNSTTKTGFLPNAAAKYIRYVGTIAGTSPSFTMGVTILGQKQRV